GRYRASGHDSCQQQYEKCFPAIHQDPSLPTISRTAATNVSISDSVLKNPVLTLTVPSGKVPMVLCARGAQCSPTRTAISKSLSRIKPVFAGSMPAIVNERTDPLGLLISLLRRMTRSMDDNPFIRRSKRKNS